MPHAESIAALGCSVHSGWAAVVAVAPTRGGFQVLVRDRIEMIDPGEPSAKQPYHTVEHLPVEEAARRLTAFSATAARLALDTLKRVVDQIAARGHRNIGLAILDSSGRKGRSLAAILAAHPLIHTADGDHFRDALAAAARRGGVPVVRIRARDLEGKAAEVLGRPIEDLRVAVKAAGREVGPPWGADQKAAALAAWVVGHTPTRPRLLRRTTTRTGSSQ